jgi:hypothetical protein
MERTEKNRGSPKQPMYNRHLAKRNNQTYELRRTRDSFPRQSSKTHRHTYPGTHVKFSHLVTSLPTNCLCIRTACHKLSTGLEQLVDNL